MKIGCPKEIKDNEFRVGMTPSMVRTLTEAGHEVVIESNAGIMSGFTNDNYRLAGAHIVENAFDADMIIKVKELQSTEFDKLKSGQIIFAYLHLAPDPEQTKKLLEKNVIAIAYETVTDSKGRLPLLIPMSEIAGRISIQAGAYHLQLNNGGKGLLLGGVPGVIPAHVVVIGAGVVGTEAARMALGLGAKVTILDKDLNRLRELDALFGPHLNTLYSSVAEIENILPSADLVIGSVLIPGKSAPKLITSKMIRSMGKGSVIIDVAIDQGGCTENSKPTSHSNPTYIIDGVIHYCVTNMPGACATTSTRALTNATSDYALQIANKGWKKALSESEGLKKGLNICYGEVTNKHVAEDLGYNYADADKFL